VSEVLDRLRIPRRNRLPKVDQLPGEFLQQDAEYVTKKFLITAQEFQNPVFVQGNHDLVANSLFGFATPAWSVHKSAIGRSNRYNGKKICFRHYSN
jgi:hypothetical protein